MGKTIFSLLFFVVFTVVKAQKVTVVDSSTKEPLSFVAIKYGDKGFYTTERGEFNLKKIDAGSFQISFTGYKNKQLSLENVGDTIFLNSISKSLDEVVINSKKKEHITIKPGRKPWFLANLSSGLLQFGKGFVVILHPKEKALSTSIEKLKLRFATVHERKEELKGKDIKCFIRVHIYDVKNDKSKRLVYNSKPFAINSYEKDEVNLDVSKSPIPFEKNGIAVELQILVYGKQKNLVKEDFKPMLRPVLTKETENAYFSMKTYLKKYFHKQDKLILLNDKYSKYTGKETIRNLSIGVELTK